METSPKENGRRKQMVFVKKIPKKIFGLVKENETGDWKAKKNNEFVEAVLKTKHIGHK